MCFLAWEFGATSGFEGRNGNPFDFGSIDGKPIVSGLFSGQIVVGIKNLLWASELGVAVHMGNIGLGTRPYGTAITSVIGIHKLIQIYSEWGWGTIENLNNPIPSFAAKLYLINNAIKLDQNLFLNINLTYNYYDLFKSILLVEWI